ncbi:hypothetical protein JCM8547_005196 [Rhodosporidiobolus lusitaniae]
MSRAFQPPHSSRPSAEQVEGCSRPSQGERDGETTHADRFEQLCACLSHAQDVLRSTSRAGNDAFSSLALALFEKAFKEVDEAVELVEKAAGAGEGRKEEQAPTPVFPPDHERSPRVNEQEQCRPNASSSCGRDEHDASQPPSRAPSRPSSSRPPSVPAVDIPRPSSRTPSLPPSTHEPHHSRPVSRQTEDAPAVPPSQLQSGMQSFSRFFKRPSSATSSNAISSPLSPPPPPVRETESETELLSPHPGRARESTTAKHGVDRPSSRVAEKNGFDRPSSRVSEISTKKLSSFDRPPSASVSSHRHRHAPSASSEEGYPLPPMMKPEPVRKRGNSRSRSIAYRDEEDEPDRQEPKRREKSRSRHAYADVCDGEGSRDEPKRREKSRSRAVSSYSDEELKSPSFAGGAGPARTSSGRSGTSEEARRALGMASAPPATEEEEREEVQQEEPVKSKEPLRLDGNKVVKAVVAASAKLEEQAATKTLLSLALVSKAYNLAATSALYSSLSVLSTSQLDKLNHTLASNPSLGAFVTSLAILPLDTAASPSPESLILPLQQLLSRLPKLLDLDENFTAGDWDVRTLSSGTDYPLTISPSSSSTLVSLSSTRAWFEIGALHELLTLQPSLRSLTLGGAAMDRDWQGGSILASLATLPDGSAPAKQLETLKIVQCMHEDTLAVLVRCCGGGSSSPLYSSLRSISLGFQSIGSTDDDTPRASIPTALALVGSTLTSFSITSPSRGSDDTTGLLDEILSVLPVLEVLEFGEHTELFPVAIGSSKTVTHFLPKTLRVLRGRSVVSVSTGKVLAMLDDPDVIPVLQEFDFRWAKGSGEEEGKEPWWKERHIARIEEACQELGIKCSVRRGDEPLVLV